jgi:mannose-6-phosphate isomerase-like protein (cupin superfamily)
MADVSADTPEKLLALHEQADARISSYSYKAPDKVGTQKGLVRLGRGDSVVAEVQILAPAGGENNLHYHSNSDSFWMVLKGKVRFYGIDNKVLGEYGPSEGLITPRFCRYWFENAVNEPTELLHIVALSNPRNPSSGRQNLNERLAHQMNHQQFDAVHR